MIGLKGLTAGGFERKDGRPVVHLGGCSTVMDCFSWKKIFKVDLRVWGRFGLIDAAPFERSPGMLLTGMSGDFRIKSQHERTWKGCRGLKQRRVRDKRGQMRGDIFQRV
jgi:hypothetical protein